MNKIFLIVGESGSGKDTVVNALCSKYGLSRVKSYTTRPSRGTQADEQSHLFVTDEEFDKLTDLVAFTNFDRYRYCATAEQVDNADLYIVDAEGVNYLKDHYHGNRDIITVRITSTDADRFVWLKERYGGDAEATELAMHRIKHDQVAFRDDVVKPIVDYTVHNSVYKTINDVADEIYDIMIKEGLNEPRD